MTLHRSTPTLELRAQAEGVVAGYASVFGGIDSYGDSIVPGAFADSLARHKRSGSAPVMLWSHQTASPIGRWQELAEDARGLRVTGQLNLGTEAGSAAFAHLKAGDLNGLSIGFNLDPADVEHRSDRRLLKRVDLMEISVVTLPADPAARITSVKQQAVKPASLREFEHALEQLGFSRREARHLAAKGYHGLSASDDSHELIAALKAATNLLKAR